MHTFTMIKAEVNGIEHEQQWSLSTVAIVFGGGFVLTNQGHFVVINELMNHLLSGFIL